MKYLIILLLLFTFCAKAQITTSVLSPTGNAKFDTARVFIRDSVTTFVTPTMLNDTANAIRTDMVSFNGIETLTNKDLTSPTNQLFKTGTVATAAATVAKVVTLNSPYASYAPVTGDLLLLTYTLGQTASSATINVNGNGAKGVRLGNATANNIGHVTAAGGTLLYRYDGTYFQLFGSQQQINTNTTYIESTTGTAITAASLTCAINNLYYANNATNVAFTLPATAAINSVVEIVGLHNSGGWTLSVPSGDSIFINGNNTGSAGTLTGAAKTTVKVRCIIANTAWEVTDYTGNITTNTGYTTSPIDTTSLSDRINARVKYSDTTGTVATQKQLKDSTMILRAAMIGMVSIGADVATSSTTFVDVSSTGNALKFPVTSGDTYWFRFIINYTQGNTSAGCAFAISGPSITTLTYRAEWNNGTSRFYQECQSGYDGTAKSTGAPNKLYNLAIMEGFIQCSASGDVIARFASSMPSNTITVKAYSSVQLKKIN